MSQQSDHALPQARAERDAHLARFRGREQILATLLHEHEGAPRSGYAAVLGGLGSGKSALLAELSRRCDAPFHFVKSHKEPQRCVASLIRQTLAKTSRPFSSDAYEMLASASADDLKNELVRALELLGQEREQVVLVLDGLDELDDAQRALSFLPAYLPPRALFVLSARPLLSLLTSLRMRLPNLFELALPPFSRSETELVAADRFSARARKPSVEQLAQLHETTGGSPLLVDRSLTQWARADDFSQAAVAASSEALFEGLLLEAQRAGGELAQRLAEVLALAAEPIRLERAQLVLAELELEAASLKDCRIALEALSAGLERSELGELRLWHGGFAEFLQTSVLGEAGVRRMHQAFAAMCARTRDDYAQRHHVRHLWQAGAKAEARALAEDADGIEARLQAGLLPEVLADLALALSAHFDALRRHGALLAERPEALRSVLQLEGLEGPSGARPWLRAQARDQARAGRPALILRGHRAEVLSLAVSPDGRTVATCSADGTLRRWDANTGAELDCTTLTSRRALTVAFSPDGRTLACGTDEHVVLLDAGSGERIAQLAHDAPVWGVAYSPEGDLATGARNGCVRVYSPSRELLWQGQAHAEITCLALDLGLLLVGCSRGGLSLFASSSNFRGGETAHERLEPQLEGSVWAVERHAGEWLIARHDGVLQRFATSSNAAAPRLELLGELSFPSEHLFAATFDPQTARIACAGSSGKVHLVTSATHTHSLVAHEGWINSMSFGPKDMLWSAGTDRTARAHELASARASEAEQPSRRINCMAVAPRGDEYALGYHDGRLELFQRADGRSKLRERAFDTSVTAVALTSRMLVAGAQDGQLALFRRTPEGLRRSATFQGHGAAVTSALVLATSGLLVSGSRDFTLRLWSMLGTREVGSVTLAASVSSLLHSHDERVLAVVCADRSVSVFAAKDLRPLGELRFEGELLAVGFATGGLELRSAHGGEVTHQRLPLPRDEGEAANEPSTSEEALQILVSGRSALGRELKLSPLECALVDKDGARLLSGPWPFLQAVRLPTERAWLVASELGPNVLNVVEAASSEG